MNFPDLFELRVPGTYDTSPILHFSDYHTILLSL